MVNGEIICFWLVNSGFAKNIAKYSELCQMIRILVVLSTSANCSIARDWVSCWRFYASENFGNILEWVIFYVFAQEPQFQFCKSNSVFFVPKIANCLRHISCAFVSGGNGRAWQRTHVETHFVAYVNVCPECPLASVTSLGSLTIYVRADIFLSGRGGLEIWDLQKNGPTFPFW